MQLTTAFRQLSRNDVKLIGRDSFLATLIGYALFMALVLRVALPPSAAYLLENHDFDLTPFYPLIIGYAALMMGPILAGMVVGFLLIDERDDGTIKAMLVTPMPLNLYLLYRVSLPMVLGYVLVIAQVYIMNLVVLPFWQLAIIALPGALLAAITTLFFATYAENKVQGFAQMKIVGSTALIAVAAWFIPEPWQYLAGFYPPYWLAKGYWAASAGQPTWLLFTAIGAGMLASVLVLLVRQFNRVAYR